jgi:predicted phage-related endonuclease
MYTLLNCEQGTSEWFEARLGKITASVFDRIITKTGKPSSSAEDLVNRAVAELITGRPDDTFQSESMLRGKDLEDQALEYFNFVYDYQFVKCGFMDSGLGYGCSPDGVCEDERIGLELKCPEAHTHLAYLAGGSLPDKYIQQVQGALMVSGFDKWIFGSYHPDLPCFKVEVQRDEKVIAPMKKLVLEACEMVKAKHEIVSKLVEAKNA